MADREKVEATTREILLEVGYSRQMADWVINEWLPPTFHLQTPEQRADWILDRDLFGQGFYDVQNQIRMFALATVAAPGIARREQREEAQWEERERYLRAQQQQQAEAERQRQIGERVRALGGMAPEAAAVSAPFLEQARGVSPAFQRVAGQQLLPDIFTELGMPQKRREWWEAGAQRIGEQLLPETRQEQELMVLKRADPWAQLLSQPTFLQQLETRFRSLSPGEKGVSTGLFRPRTRWLH